MNFPVLLLAALIIRLTPWRAGLPLDLPGIWVAQACRWLGLTDPARRETAWWLPLWLLLPLLPLGLMLWVLEGWAYGAGTFVLHLLILLASIGRSDPLGRYGAHFEQAWMRGDMAAASLVAEREFGARAEDASSLLETVRGRLAWETLNAYFVPVFWFVLVGPLAALAYRCWWVAAERLPGPHLTASLVHALEWLPLRLVGLALALVGRFDPTIVQVKGLLARWDISSAAAIAACLRAALGPDDAEPLVSARALLERAVLVWALVIAFIGLAG